MDDKRLGLARSLRVCVVLVLAVFAPVKGGPNALYPYGPSTGDTDVSNMGTQGHTVNLPMGIPMKYYGQTSNTAYILRDGMVSLEPGVTYQPLKWREGTANHAIDLPFIAPFHYDGFKALTNPDLYHGKIYYKLIDRSRNNPTLPEQDRAFMESLDQYLMSASVAVKTGFISQFVLKVTWENVTSKTDCSDSKLQTPDGCPSNTFQVVLVGNLDYTFAIFNYYKMEIPFSEHQVAGVNGGHGRGWTDVIPCTGACTKRSKLDKKRITSLASDAGSDVAGRYILVIGGDNIIRGGCLPEGFKSEELEVYPRRAGMFGGELLAVSATCRDPDSKIYCRFTGMDQTDQTAQSQRSEGIMETRMRGRCPVPTLTTRGEVLMEISFDNMDWTHRTNITIILPNRLHRPPLDMDGISDPWYEINPKELEIRWNSRVFSHVREATLDINLIGYKEDAYSTTNPLEMRTLAKLATGVLNSDSEHRIDPSQFSCTSECEDFEIGLVQLRMPDQYIDNTTQYQTLTYGPVALGWYVNNAMIQRHGNDWPAAKCREWNGQDKLTTAWLEELLPCPCTLSQALADWGRWQPDLGCNMFTGSTCYYHKGAKHCVRSVHPTRSGSGNQCCYEQDGSLRYAADTYQGSTPDRSHDWGAAPFGKPNRVPSMSHWIHDVITFYYCCLWTEYGECNYYMDRRPTSDCKHYRPAHSAIVYGDPHITTFDNKSYHFGGQGDFWLLKSDKGINIQGRFEQREDEYLQMQTNQIRPTNLTSLVMWIRQSNVVTVRLAPTMPSDRKLDIRINGRRRFFENPSERWQDFAGVSIVNNAQLGNSEDQHHNNFTILFYGGAAVQVAERQKLFHVVVTLPPDHDRVSGLLGTLDGDPTNDFTTPQGVVIPTDADEDHVYLDFALKWNVSNNESRFHWPKAAEATKSPLFGDPKEFPYKDNNRKPDENDITRVCGNSQPCRRDYYVSNDEQVARSTREAEAAFRALQNKQTTVLSCGLLDIPMAVKSPLDYSEGSTVTVTGCRPNNDPVQGSGSVTYVCRNVSGSSGPQWSPQPVRTLCPYSLGTQSSPQKASDTGMIIGIVVGVVAALALLVLVLVIIIRRRRQSSEEVSESAKPVPAKRSARQADIVIEPGAEETFLKAREAERDRVRMSDVKKRSGSEEAV